MTAKIDFVVSEVVRDGFVIGRNGEGEIRLGTTFMALHRRVFPSRLPGEGIVSPEPEFVCQVCLRVDSIELYRRSMDFLSPGCTALLGLSGTGLNELSPLLETAQPGTYYSLVD